MQLHDEASRGPAGAVTFLLGLHGRPPASLSALVTILALAYDPFVQQVLSYPPRREAVIGYTPCTNRAASYHHSWDSDEVGNSINAGAFGSSDQFRRVPDCSTGDCAWEQFRSIGWCSKCVNATAYAELSQCDLNQIQHDFLWDGTTLPDSPRIVSFGHGSTITLTGRQQQAVYPYVTLTTDAVWQVAGLNGTEYLEQTYLDIKAPIIDLAYVSLGIRENGTNQTAVIRFAEECVLSLCERTYNVSTALGLTTAEVLNENYGSISRGPVQEQNGKYSNAFQQYYCWQPEPGNSNCTVVGLNQTTISKQFGWTAESVQGSAIILNASLSGTRKIDFNNSDLDAVPQLPEQLLPVHDNLAVSRVRTSNLSTVVESVAASLTAVGLLGSDGVEVVHGIAYASVQHVHASLEWLILPFVLQACTLVLLPVTMMTTARSKIKLWKSSVLPLLYHRRQKDELHLTGGENFLHDTVSEMTVLARHRRVRFLDAKGEKTVLDG